MYEEFFGFNAKPFDLLPNPDLLFMSKTHGKALSYLRYGIQERAGFILLTGEVGAGKTTLIRELINRHLENVTLSKVFNTKADSQQLLTMINDDFSLETEGRSKATMIRDLNEFLIDEYAAGRRAVLIIDEAQNLNTELLEEIRMLSNLETDGGKLLQIILVGQPELRQTLDTPELLQLRQRIQIGCHIQPLNAEEVKEYVYYRMERAGNRDAVQFTDQALYLVHEQSRGIPRLINILCDYLLIDSFANQKNTVNEADVSDIVTELDFERQYWQSSAPSSSDERHQGAQPSKKPGTHVSGKNPIGAKRLPPRAEKVLRQIRGVESRIEFLEKNLVRDSEKTNLENVERLERLERQVSRIEQQLEALFNMNASNFRGVGRETAPQPTPQQQTAPAPQKPAAPEPVTPAESAEEGDGDIPPRPRTGYQPQDRPPVRRGWAYRLLFGSD
ncbi:MAG: ATPase [Desulfovibrio sp.]|nr:ATPase [Desulfovibrio sp.]|tara:strand:- start:3247 stop:4584 length:1338 start_codon:yes stop_codon:yes gene_type:complete